jgi:hypothetical protein
VEAVAAVVEEDNPIAAINICKSLLYFVCLFVFFIYLYIHRTMAYAGW